MTPSSPFLPTHPNPSEALPLPDQYASFRRTIVLHEQLACPAVIATRASWRLGLRQSVVGPEPLLQAVHEVVGAAPFLPEAVRAHLEDV
jgi:hypothetical protein